MNENYQLFIEDETQLHNQTETRRVFQNFEKTLRKSKDLITLSDISFFGFLIYCGKYEFNLNQIDNGGMSRDRGRHLFFYSFDFDPFSECTLIVMIH